MSDLSRRDLLRVGLAASLGATVAPTVARSSTAGDEAAPATGPVAIASRNGLPSVERAYALLTADEDPLDAAIAGVEILELDPEEQGVGLGGLPNEEGVVQLDASCMHGPTRRAGAVAALEGIATPSLVAKAVLEHTDHILLAGEGAKRFALQLGFEERELLTDASRQAWLRWKTRLNDRDNWIEPDPDGEVPHELGTVNLCARTAAGDLASVTTTSGLSWKIPGRVGDSPIVGAGQYCDNEVGAAGSTGRGEANIKACGAFLVVEEMRRGAAPAEACLTALERVVAMTEDRLLDEHGRPRFGLAYYALDKSGRHGAARLYEPSPESAAKGAGTYAVADAGGARLEPARYLFSYEQRPARRA